MPSDYVHLAARHVAKFLRATPPTCEVIDAYSLNFKPIFNPHCENCKMGPKSPVRVR